MKGKHVGIALVTLLASAAPALAQNEQFIPNLVYRTGAYAPNGIPVANGVANYYKLVNERDVGINGIVFAADRPHATGHFRIDLHLPRPRCVI